MLAHQMNDNFRTKDVIVVENITFESLLLSDEIIKGLSKNGFKKPSPIQLKAIPVGRCGFDLIVKSKSGTGKTLVFSIIALESLKSKPNKLEVLILSPTREIAVQTGDVIKLLGQYFKGLNVVSFIGGLSLSEDKENCKTCHIAVGTPGRVKQLITEKFLNTDSIRLFVLDEADKLMEESFKNDINTIYNSLPFKKQIITTSATYPNQLEEFLSKYMLSPTHITAELDSPLLLGLKQFVVVTKPNLTAVQLMKIKTEELVNIITNISFTQCLIFSNYQSKTESLSNILNGKDWPSTYISAAQTQIQRLAAVNELKNFKCRIMFCTDLAARGIDAANVDLIINFDIPVDATTYLHRMGRAGRYGSTGVCINLASEGTELSHLQEILGYIGGTALSVPKLPTFNGSIAELLKVEVPLENHVFGTINKNKKDKDISKIFEIVKKENKNDKNLDLQNNETNSELEEIEKQISDMDTDSILNSLINQDLKIESTSQKNEKNIQEFDVNAVLKSLTESLHKSPSNKVQEPPKMVLSDMEIQEKNKNTLLTKNKALLNVSKILDGSTKIEDLLSIEQHLSDLKSEAASQSNELSKDDLNILNILSKDFQEAACEGIASTSKLSNIESNCANLQTFEESEGSDNENDPSQFNIQNLFQFGYKNIVKSRNSQWRKILPEIIRTPIIISDGEEDDDNDDDDDYNKENMENETSESDSDIQNSDKQNSKVSQSLDVEMIEEDNRKSKKKIAEDSLKENKFELMSIEEKTKSQNISTDDNGEISQVYEMQNKDRRKKKSVKISKESELKNLLSDDSDDSIPRNKIKGRKAKKYLEITEKNEYSSDVDVMKWIPVENTDKTDTVKHNYFLETNTSTDDSNQFSPYFEECSNHLWHNGLNFDSVDAFDDWFYYEWEAQLYSVRNYVQQNVYINEMAKYQNSMRD